MGQQVSSNHQSWINNWSNIMTFFDYPDEIRKVIYLAIEAVSKQWTMLIQNWKHASNHFMIEFEEQLTPHL